jgi:hypothetical protein
VDKQKSSKNNVIGESFSSQALDKTYIFPITFLLPPYCGTSGLCYQCCGSGSGSVSAWIRIDFDTLDLHSNEDADADLGGLK